MRRESKGGGEERERHCLKMEGKRRRERGGRGRNETGIFVFLLVFANILLSPSQRKWIEDNYV